MSNNSDPVSIKNSKVRNIKTATDYGIGNIGRVLPQAIPVEEAVLGAILINSNSMSEVLEVINADVFYLDKHRKIFGAMMRLFNRTQPIDLITVHEELKKSSELDEVGGPLFLAELTTKVGSSANVEFHARILVQKYLQRELIHVSNNIIQDSFEDTKDVFDILDAAEQQLFNISDKQLSTGPQSFSLLSSQLRKRLDSLQEKQDGLTGVPSGLKRLDAITSGWQNSDLVIIAARPSVGKTALVLSMGVNAAKAGFPIAIFSLEMSSLQMAQRIVSMEAEISSTKLRDGNLTDQELERFHTTLQTKSELGIYIDDTPQINVFELRAKCRRLKTQHGIRMIIIDYLQLMSAGSDNKTGNNRNLEVGIISRALKGLAKELDVPVIALSQLSRSVETRADKKPQLSDLRDSGSIEQDADIVGFIFRPDYHNLGDGNMINESETEAELIIAKHRNGALGTVNMRFQKDFAKYSDADPRNFFNPLANPSTSGSMQGASPDTGNKVMVKVESRANDDLFIDVPF